jgi:hypothetical protein
MANEIVPFIDSIKSNKQIASFDETSVKQTIVMKLLFMLGWDIFNVDEVSPNYSVGKRQIDYALRIKTKNKVFINVKKAAESLEKYQKELFGYASKEQVDFSILTNGILWWFYLTLDEESLGQKKICSLNFLSQDSDDIAGQLKDFLDKDQIAKGKASKSAETILKKRHQNLIEKTLPEAWTEVISNPPDLLVDLLSETTEKICGYAPEKKTVITFISESLNQSQRPVIPAPSIKTPAVPYPAPKNSDRPASNEKTIPAPRGYNGRSISSFSFKQKNYKIRAWEDLVLKLCEVLSTQYGQDVEKLLWHSVGEKYYFSRNSDELRFPENIKDTGIFVETYMTPNEAAKTAQSVLSFFEYSEADFSISTEKT